MKKKIYTYFTSFFIECREQRGWGNVVYTLSEPLDTSERLRELEASLRKKMGADKVVVVNFQLMKCEEVEA